MAPPDSPECHNLLAKFLQVCKLLGFPVAAEKVDGPVTSTVFLGLELDSDLTHIQSGIPCRNQQSLPTARVEAPNTKEPKAQAGSTRG